MARYKNDPANEGYNAGDLFNYEVWTADTELTLCNVPWDAAYKDVVHFESTNALNAYIDATGDRTNISNAVYARINEPISIDMPLGRAQQYNYVRVYNPAQPVNQPDVPRYYYYFIRAIRHVAPETTEIVVQLDVWQTRIRNVKFGRAYIDRGHIGIANQQAFNAYGRHYLTIAEGLDTGADYVNVVQKRVDIMRAITNTGPNAPKAYMVMAVSTVDLNGDHGTESAPKNPSARPTWLQGTIPTGAGVYLWENALDFMSFMSDFSKKPWVTAGIVSITLIPDMRSLGANSSFLQGTKDPKTRAYRGLSNISPIKKELYRNWRNSTDVVNYLPSRYRSLKKFFTSPYCMLEMTFSAGSSIVMKPENWNNDHASIAFFWSSAPPNQRLAAVPLNYNGRNKTNNLPWWEKERDGFSGYDGDFLDMALFLSSFPTIPIVNNGQILALANSARSIAQQYKSNDWSQQKALQGNQVAYDQASMGINAGVDLANNSMNLDSQSTAIAQNLASQQALLNLFGGTASGAGMGAFGGPLGAVAGGIGGAVSGGMNMLNSGLQGDAANAQLAARTAAGSNARDINSNLGANIRDTNKGLADWAAKGDYANARAMMDAKIQDTQMTPHGTSGQFGGEAFNLVTDNMALTLKVKMIDQASIAVVGEYWLRYGYPVRRSAFIPNDLRVMDKFSYWKMSEVYIRTAAMPESDKQTIRGILEKGVTVWNNADDIGRIDFADNRPLPGIVIEGYEPPPWENEETPEPPVKPKRKKRKMLVYATNDAGMKWALAGTSPGTTANFIITDSQILAEQFMVSCGVEEPVLVDVTTFYEYQNLYTGPVSTLEYVEGV